MLQFKKYQSKDYSVIQNINILEGDHQYTKTPLENIEAAKTDSERHPNIVMLDQQCVAYFTLHEGTGVRPYSDNPNAMLFRSFTVDANFRHQGIGKEVMRRLPDFISREFPGFNEIILTVNTDNPSAIHLYEQQGYQYKGEGTLLERPIYIMSQSIK